MNTSNTQIAKVPKTVVVRYGYLGFIGEFECDSDENFPVNHSILVETTRGVELGEVVCSVCESTGVRSVSREDVDGYVRKSGSDYLTPHAGKVIRLANEQDLLEARHIRMEAEDKRQYCTILTEKMNLRMQVVFVEQVFGGERVIFYFLSEGRVDFRELVRDLAREYQTRIELRQIGARDEARLLADYEICGRECCCKNFLKTLRPVNMKMAKLQKATLDPSKVSGRCGRLRCCLQFEQKTYEELVSHLPKIGSWVDTEYGVGRVRGISAISQIVKVVFPDNRFVSFPVEEVSPASKPAAVSAPGAKGRKEDKGRKPAEERQSRQSRGGGRRRGGRGRSKSR